jgi:hypothetical protein
MNESNAPVYRLVTVNKANYEYLIKTGTKEEMEQESERLRKLGYPTYVRPGASDQTEGDAS